MGAKKRKVVQPNTAKLLQEQQPGRVIRIQTVPTGSSGTEIFSGFFDEEYLQTLTNTERADEFDRMRRGDAKIKSVLSAVKNPIKGATWEWLPAKDADETMKTHARFLEKVFFECMNKKWSQFLIEATSLVDFGHVVFEKVFNVIENDPEFGTFNGIAQLGWRSPRTLEEWFIDRDSGMLTGLQQRAFGDLESDVIMDGKDLCVISLDKEGDLYEGVSMLRAAYGAWRRKQVYLKLMAIGVEKYAIPTPIAEIPVGKNNSTEFAALIKTLEAYTSHEKNYLTKPAGWGIDFFDKNVFDPAKVRSAVEFENMEITFAFLANFLELGVSGKGGAYALSNDLSDFFLKGIEFIATLIGECLDDVGKDLIIMNFGVQPAYPTLRASGIADKAGEELSNILKNLSPSEGGYITPDETLETHLRRRLKLPPVDLETRRTPEPPAPINPIDSANPTDGTPGPTKDGPGDKPNEAVVNPDDGEEIQLGENIYPKVPGKKNKPGSEHLDKKKKKNASKHDKKGSETDKSLTKFAETARKQIDEGKIKLDAVIADNLRRIGDLMVNDLLREGAKLSPSNKESAINKVNARGLAEFRRDMLDITAEVSADALRNAQREVPGAPKVLNEFDKLPKDVQRRLKNQANLLVNTSTNDLEKAVFFTYGESVLSTDSVNQVEADIKKAADDALTSPSVRVAGANQAAKVINDTRLSYFQDDEVSKQINSFTFINPAPVSAICTELAGVTFSKDDPNFVRFHPPLHHNCKSYLRANVKSDPEIDSVGLQPAGREVSVEDALKSITLKPVGI